MIAGIVALGAMALACAGIVALGARVAGRSALDGARWRQTHLPMLAAIVCGLAAAGHDPLSVALRSGGVAPTLIRSAFLWLVIGLPIAAVSISAGIGLLRGASVSIAGVWCAAATGSLACGLTLAGRISLLDGQLMMLAGLALSWWRAGATQRDSDRSRRATWEAPAAYALAFVGGIAALCSGGQLYMLAGVAAIAMVTVTAALALSSRGVAERAPIGEESWTALGAMLMGLGIVTVARIGVMGYAEVQRAALMTGDPPVIAIADVVWSGPYVGGLAMQAPEALWLLALAGVIVLAGRDRERRIGAGLLCIGLGVASGAWRVVSWAASGG